jgi:outer membrane protein assembly factor BamB
MTVADGKPGGELQTLLDHAAAGTAVDLPAGEYEGPVFIRHPLTLSGRGGAAAIWASYGPVVTVESPGVSLRNLSIEVTDLPSALGVDETCALSLRPEAADLHTEDIRVAGSVAGARDEEGEWVFPTRFDLGNVAGAPGALLGKTLALSVPVACTVLSAIPGLAPESKELPPGTHQLRLRLDRGAAAGELAGSLILKTRLVSRCIDVSGRLTITAQEPPAARRQEPEPPPASRRPAPEAPAASPPRRPASPEPGRPPAAPTTAGPTRAAAPRAGPPAMPAPAPPAPDKVSHGAPIESAPAPPRPGFNLLAQAALVCGSLALALAAYRLFAAPASPPSPWVGRSALVLGLAALVSGVGGYRQARRSAGAEAGRSIVALAAGALALVLQAWPPATPAGLASISRLQPLPPPAAGGERVTALALSPDGSELAGVSGGQTVKVFRTRTGELKWQAATSDGEVHAVAVSPDGKTLATAGSSPKILLWRRSESDGEPPSVLRGLSDWVKPATSMAFSPDGNLLAAGAQEGVIRLWNTQASELSKVNEPSTLTRHDDAVLALAFSADGKWLVSGGEDRKVVLWDRVKAEPEVFRGLSVEVLSVAVANDGSLIAAGMKDGTILLWERTNPLPKLTLPGHAGPVLAVLFSADARTLASAAEAPGLTLWDPQTGTPIRTLPAAAKPATSVSLSRDGATLAALSADGTLDVWRAQ